MQMEERGGTEHLGPPPLKNGWFFRLVLSLSFLLFVFSGFFFSFFLSRQMRGPGEWGAPLLQQGGRRIGLQGSAGRGWDFESPCKR